MANTSLPCRLTCCREQMSTGLHMVDGRITLWDGDRSFQVHVPDLQLATGQALALTGASGSGKTLILEMLGLLRAPEAGTTYCVDGTNLAPLWRGGPRNPKLAEMRGRLFGFVPQSGGLLPFLTVAENIAVPQRVCQRPDPVWCTTLVDRLGLNDQAGQYPASLSIGQRQRTAIARALSHRPRIVIADEPTSALDPTSADQVLALFLEIAAEQGAGVILSSHDLARMARHGIAQRNLVVEPGWPVKSRLEEGPC